jgi:Cu-Zn family superoxide dismutase
MTNTKEILMRTSTIFAALAAVGLIATGCTSLDFKTEVANHRAAKVAPTAVAIAVVHPTEGNTAKGTVRFLQTSTGVTIIADISGLKPNAFHGFHIHQFGDCSAANGKSAGGHYNPEGHDHGGPSADKRHAGDLGNLKADGNGNAKLEMTVHNITVAGHKNPVVGRGIIVHEGQDDLRSQPTGAAGPRIGCGTIGLSHP